VRPSTGEEQEVRQFLRERVRAIEALSWEELDRYGKQTESLTTATGNTYRVVSRAYWDMEQWASGMEISAKAYAPSGWRRRWPYTAVGGRGGPTDPVGEPPTGWTAPRRRWSQRPFDFANRFAKRS
jgi:hypothetical protein